VPRLYPRGKPAGELRGESRGADVYAERSLQDFRAAADEGRLVDRQRAATMEKRSPRTPRGNCRHLPLRERARATGDTEISRTASGLPGTGDLACPTEPGGTRPPVGNAKGQLPAGRRRRLVRCAAGPRNSFR